MSQDIRFSVIVPAYNAAATIVASLDTVLGQTLPPFEVIVVNDGSTDQTEQLLSDHFAGRIRYIPLPVNGGPARARNAGLAQARGTHIAFQDADDHWHPDKLRIMAAVIDENPAAAFIYHPYTLSPLDFRAGQYAWTARPYPFRNLLLSNPIGTPCVVMAFRQDIRFDERMHYMEDYDLFLREGYRHGILLVDIPLTRLGRPILSEGGQSSRRWEMRKGEFRAYLNLARLHPAFIFVSLFLICFGLLKHAVKSFFPPRTNY